MTSEHVPDRVCEQGCRKMIVIMQKRQRGVSGTTHFEIPSHLLKPPCCEREEATSLMYRGQEPDLAHNKVLRCSSDYIAACVC